MIFQPSVELDARLSGVMEDCERSEIGVRVLAGRVFRIPYFVISLDVVIQVARRFNVLEEFVMRAAHEFASPPARMFVAGILGLDPIFVNSVCDNLQGLGVLQNGENLICLTEKGRESYRLREVPQPPKRERVTFFYSELAWGLTARRLKVISADTDSDLVPASEMALETSDGTKLRPDSKALSSILTLDTIIDACSNAGLGHHLPSSGKRIVGFEQVNVDEVGQAGFGLLIARDSLTTSEVSDNVVIRVYDLSTGQRASSAEEWAENQIKSGMLNIEAMLPPVSESLVPERVSQIEKAFQDQASVKARLNDQVAESASAPIPKPQSEKRTTIELLRNEDIRPRFLQTIRETKRTLRILSPWMNESVVDDSFRSDLVDLAKQRVVTMVGWGIATDRASEDRAPSQQLLDSLDGIKDADNLPAVLVWWVGNQHAKEVVSDRRLHLCGSHNFLSYRGDRRIRGESIYAVSEAAPVQEAADALDDLYAHAAELRWNELMFGIAKAPYNDLVRCCLTWATTRRTELVYGRLLSLASTGAREIADCIEMLLATNRLITRLLPIELDSAKVLQHVSETFEPMFQNAAKGNQGDPVPSSFGGAYLVLLKKLAAQNETAVIAFLERHAEIAQQSKLVRPDVSIVEQVQRWAIQLKKNSQKIPKAT